MKLLSVVGARPQFVKLGPIDRALEAHNAEHLQSPVEHRVVHTGQHYDANLSRVFFEQLHLPQPDHNLDVGSGPHGQQTGRMLEAVERVLLEEKPDVVLVLGDTNSTLAAALAAAKLHIPLAHVEAGLRSFDKNMPEEINRVLTDHLSDWLFCPTQGSLDNLVAEGIITGAYEVGDVMYDSVLYHAKLAERASHILDTLQLQPQAYALATVHRAQNTDDPERLGAVFAALRQIAEEQLPVVLPLHPRTQQQVMAAEIDTQGVRLVEPVAYLDMLTLERHAAVVLTDSGGVQKEAYWFDVPCVTLRPETEWVETLDAGRNVLADANAEHIVEAACHRHPKTGQTNLYGDGHAAEKIVTALLCEIAE